MRIIMLLALLISTACYADVYKCQISEKQFIYQAFPCAEPHKQNVLNIKPQTPEQIERAKQLQEATKEERKTLDEAAQKQQLIDMQRQAEIEKQRADVARQEAEAAKRAAIDAQRAAQQQNTTTVITPYVPYYPYHPYPQPYYPQHYPQTSPFYSPERSLSPNFSPYPNTGSEFAPYPRPNRTVITPAR